MAAIPPHKRNFGMMFQEDALFLHKNVADNIGFGLKMSKWTKDKQEQRIRDMLKLVGLQKMAREK
jgi:ABC-type Fe3+/spermidine/putrescine transport system ATPase subunit